MSFFYQLSYQGIPQKVYNHSLGQNTGVGSLFLLQGIFRTQGSNPGLPHCRQTLYRLSHQGIYSVADWGEEMLYWDEKTKLNFKKNAYFKTL